MGAELAFYHPNGKGTGGAVKFSLIPADGEEFVDGGLRVAMASQVKGNGFETYPRFDWDRVIEVRLGFLDVARMLQVFRGETESINDGLGLFVFNPLCRMKFSLRHVVEPVAGYEIELVRKIGEAGQEDSVKVMLMGVEGLRLCCALEKSMGVLAFGK